MQVMAFYHKREATLQTGIISVMDDALYRMRLPSITMVQDTDGAIVVSFVLHLTTQNSCSIKIDLP